MARNRSCGSALAWAVALACGAALSLAAEAQEAKPALQAPLNLLAPPSSAPVVPQSALPDFLRGPAYIPQDAGLGGQEATAPMPSPLSGTLEAPMVHSLDRAAPRVMQGRKPGEVADH